VDAKVRIFLINANKYLCISLINSNYMENKPHKAGFVSIIGKPNAGKSTLMNALMGEKLSIITPKAQTTRHRIMGILNTDDYQIVYSDTPGILKPQYELHKAMMRYVNFSLEDADAILVVIDISDKEEQTEVLEKLQRTTTSLIVILNKIDLADEAIVKEAIEKWSALPNTKTVIPVSALKLFNTELVLQELLKLMPEHPAYYDKEKGELTDRPERFFAAEIIREQIFRFYDQEIPYSSEVAIESFKEGKDILKVAAIIYVERDSQKGIIIGKAGSMLKKVGTEARKAMEIFFGKKVFLETFVKVEPNWRSNEQKLRRFGYEQ
jgi:GTP-binding protein Era